MTKENIYRFIPNTSKTIFTRFDAKLRRVEILRVECKYKDNGEIERVDVFYINK